MRFLSIYKTAERNAPPSQEEMATMGKLVEEGFTAEPLCLSGNPSERILTGAENHHADLIVVGAKGLGAIDRFLLGSISTRVVQKAKGAVLVVR